MAEGALPANPGVNDVAAVLNGADGGGVADALDPNMAYPPSLRGISFEHDVWNRVKKHPVRNPNLFQNSLDDDPESREIARQVLAAAQAREAQILNYHMTRVFSHVLSEVTTSLRQFLASPLIRFSPTSDVPEAQRRLAQAAPAEGQAAQPAPAPANGPPVQPRDGATWKAMFAHVVDWVLTPKYIIFVVLAFLGIAVGWSQLELHHLRQATSSWESSAKANEAVRDGMNSTIESSKKQSLELTRKLEERDQEVARIQSDLNSAKLELEIAKNSNDSSETKVTNLQQELDSLRQSTTIDENAKDTKISELGDTVAELQKSLADSDAAIKISDAEKVRLQDRQRDLVTEQTQLMGRLSATTEQISQLQSKILDLHDQQAMLVDANACINGIAQKLSSWHNDEDLRRYIEVYRTQQQTRSAVRQDR